MDFYEQEAEAALLAAFVSRLGQRSVIDVGAAAATPPRARALPRLPADT